MTSKNLYVTIELVKGGEIWLLVTRQYSITRKHLEYIEGMAKSTGLTKSEIVRRILDEYIKNKMEESKNGK